MPESAQFENNESDPSVSVAARTAFRVSAVYLAFYILQRYADFWASIPPSIDAVFRTVVVVLMAKSALRREKKRRPKFDFASDAFISAAFFYGITLAILYAVQIWVITAELIGKGGMTFEEEVKFVLGIGDFSTSWIVKAFIYSHVPYFAYYVTVRMAK